MHPVCWVSRTVPREFPCRQSGLRPELSLRAEHRLRRPEPSRPCPRVCGKIDCPFDALLRCCSYQVGKLYRTGRAWNDIRGGRVTYVPWMTLSCCEVLTNDKVNLANCPFHPAVVRNQGLSLRMRALLFGSDSSGSVTIVYLLCNPDSVSSQRRSSTPACAAALRSRSSRVASGSRSRRARSK